MCGRSGPRALSAHRTRCPPRPVYLRDLDHLGRLAQYTTAPWGRGHFTIDPDALLNSLAIGIMVGHEVLHCAQDFFDTRSPAKWKTLNYDRLCLDEATASWFEGKFYPEDDSYPLSMNLVYYSMPLNSFAGLKGYSIAETGYGLSSMIRYIVESQGEGRIREMYERFVEVGYDQEAVQDVVDPPMADWIVAFHHRQVMNLNYPYLQPGELWYDLPSDGAMVGGDHQLFLPTMKLWEMGADVVVFTVVDERDVPDSVRIEDLPGLTRVHEKFMVMGTRLALGHDPSMEIRIMSDAGRVVGNQYYAQWDSVDTNYNIHYYGHMSLTFNRETMALVAWSGQTFSYFTDILTLRTVTVAGSGLPLDWDQGDAFLYGGSQPESCGVITNLEVTRHVDGKLKDWLMSYYCDDNSYLSVSLRKEE